MENGKIEFIEAFKNRTKLFVLRTIKLFQALPKTEEARIVGRQLLRSATSVGKLPSSLSRPKQKRIFC